MEKKEEQKVVKVCPIISTMEMAVLRNKLDNTVKNYPKFVPMGCLGEACMFYNADFKQCLFTIQTIMISNIAGKYLNLERKDNGKEEK